MICMFMILLLSFIMIMSCLVLPAFSHSFHLPSFHLALTIIHTQVNYCQIKE